MLVRDPPQECAGLRRHSSTGVFVMRCKGTGYPRPAARETNQDSHCTAASGAAADCRDGDVLLRSE